MPGRRRASPKRANASRRSAGASRLPHRDRSTPGPASTVVPSVGRTTGASRRPVRVVAFSPDRSHSIRSSEASEIDLGTVLEMGGGSELVDSLLPAPGPGEAGGATPRASARHRHLGASMGGAGRAMGKDGAVKRGRGVQSRHGLHTRERQWDAGFAQNVSDNAHILEFGRRQREHEAAASHRGESRAPRFCALQGPSLTHPLRDAASMKQKRSAPPWQRRGAHPRRQRAAARRPPRSSVGASPRPDAACRVPPVVAQVFMPAPGASRRARRLWSGRCGWARWERRMLEAASFSPASSESPCREAALLRREAPSTPLLEAVRLAPVAAPDLPLLSWCELARGWRVARRRTGDRVCTPPCRDRRRRAPPPLPCATTRTAQHRWCVRRLGARTRLVGCEALRQRQSRRLWGASRRGSGRVSPARTGKHSPPAWSRSGTPSSFPNGACHRHHPLLLPCAARAHSPPYSYSQGPRRLLRRLPRPTHGRCGHADQLPTGTAAHSPRPTAGAGRAGAQLSRSDEAGAGRGGGARWRHEGGRGCGDGLGGAGRRRCWWHRRRRPQACVVGGTRTGTAAPRRPPAGTAPRRGRDAGGDCVAPAHVAPTPVQVAGLQLSARGAEHHVPPSPGPRATNPPSSSQMVDRHQQLETAATARAVSLTAATAQDLLLVLQRTAWVPDASVDAVHVPAEERAAVSDLNEASSVLVAEPYVSQRVVQEAQRLAARGEFIPLLRWWPPYAQRVSSMADGAAPCVRVGAGQEAATPAPTPSAPAHAAPTTSPAPGSRVSRRAGLAPLAAHAVRVAPHRPRGASARRRRWEHSPASSKRHSSRRAVDPPVPSAAPAHRTLVRERRVLGSGRRQYSVVLLLLEGPSTAGEHSTTGSKLVVCVQVRARESSAPLAIIPTPPPAHRPCALSPLCRTLRPGDCPPR